MFCSNCGAKINDGAKFCNNCGAPQAGTMAVTSMPTPSSTKFVPAKCTNCGGTLDVDPTQQAAVCPYCNSAFIVEKAIQNYNINGNINVNGATINVQGFNSDNLIARAKDFEAQADYDNAEIYFNKVLDMDINNAEAKQGIARVEEARMNHVYFLCENPNLFSSGKEVIEFKRDRVTVTSSKGKVEEFYYNKMRKLDFSLVSIQFEYPGKWVAVVLGCNSRENAKAIVDFISNALMGIYPKK